MPVFDREWRTPSQAVPRDELGNETLICRWYVEAKLCGARVWKGVFDNRSDFDEFLWSMASGTLRWDQYVQHLPRPWFDPELLEQEGLHWIYAATRSITSVSGSNQTDTVPSDWGSTTNFIDCIASGGSGAAAGINGNAATGGSGAACSRKNNVSLTPGGSATYRLSAGGSAPSVGFAISAGSAGADCWYNGASLGAASVGAKGGLGGITNASGVTAGVAGGVASSGVGSSRYSGGASGSADSSGGTTQAASGGGGSATSAGNGVASGNASPNSQTSGGASGSGRAGGGTGAAGGAGTEYGSVGGGGGGGGQFGGNGGSGGLYGAGGGAGCLVAGVSGGAGRQALIWFNYTPALKRFSFNSPMLGM